MGQRILMHLLLLLLMCSFIIPPLSASEVLLDASEDSQELPFEHAFESDPLTTGSELQLSGQNNSNEQQILIRSQHRR